MSAKTRNGPGPAEVRKLQAPPGGKRPPRAGCLASRDVWVSLRYGDVTRGSALVATRLAPERRGRSLGTAPGRQVAVPLGRRTLWSPRHRTTATRAHSAPPGHGPIPNGQLASYPP